ncbi:MAG: hypothetical protein WBG29_05585, partial [Candidatus Acidiferrales bacterium]
PLPIRLAEKNRQEEVVVLVDRMLEMNGKRYSGKLAPSELERLEREITATDAEIDDWVYALYEITNLERKIIDISDHSA